MWDAAFATAALPSSARILGLDLRPYSIGHQLRLQAEDNPFTADAPIVTALSQDDVARAVWICTMSWRELRRESRYSRIKYWAWRVLCRHSDFEEAEGCFWDYWRRGSEWAPTRRRDDDKSRPLGGPELTRLIQFLLCVLKKGEEEVYDYPLALANWHYASWLETEGCCNILNEDEVEFLAWCEEQDREKARKRQEAGNG